MDLKYEKEEKPLFHNFPEHTPKLHTGKAAGGSCLDVHTNSRRSSLRGVSFLLFLAIVASFVLAGCHKEPQPITRTSFQLNTVVTVTIYDSQDQALLDGCMELCKRYEAIFSRTLEDSELSLLNAQAALPENAGKPLPLSGELAALTAAGLSYSQLSQGAFDLTIAPLSSLWDFTAPEPVIPEAFALETARPLVDYRKISLSMQQLSTEKSPSEASHDASEQASFITFQEPGMALDLGAIAKGYIADRMKEYLLSQGVKSAIIDLGGNILCVGEKPDGSPFKVGIQKPFADRSQLIAYVNIRDLSVVSSGIYERCFTLDGQFYHHLLDPHTGYPYENHLVSVTIICPDSVDGDGLSTSCFALGLEKGLELLNSLDQVHGIFITDNDEIYYTDGFSEALSVTEV
ncbi:MAG: FAD:protein FMN transferase [Lachnospiraceae bacterium]|jgi:thiamine biosynthesis lipoprotein|nr:FAD:protein FMN transferase [Lachnospiraceae bacterium]